MARSVVLALGASALVANMGAQAPCSAPPCAPIRPDMVSWLTDFAGQPEHDVTMHSGFRELVTAVSPNAIYHFHIDLPMAAALQTILGAFGQPVVVRDGRYVTISSCSTAACTNGRAFLWADTRDATAFAGIEFNPTNGEPTPTETVFSATVNQRVTKRIALPAAFLQDLGAWERQSRLRPPMVHYFIGNDGRKTLLPNDDEACQGADRNSLQLTLCAAANLEAADKDVQAAFLLLLNDHAEGTPVRAALQADQDKWLHDRVTACPGGAADAAAVACRLKSARERVQALLAVDAR